MTSAARSFESYHERSQSNPDVTERDREALDALYRELTRRPDLSDSRKRDLMGHNLRIALAVDDASAAFESEERRDEVLDWIYETYSGETSQDYRSAFRQWCRNVEGSLTDVMEEVSSGTYNVDKRPHPDDFISLEEAQQMIEAAENPRDKALVAMAFELGPRSGELYNLERRHVITDPETSAPLQVQFYGKTREQRTVDMRIFPSHVSRWLDYHTGGSESPLWTRLATSGYTEGDDEGEVSQISQRAYLNVFKRLAGKDTDEPLVDKEVTPTNFRRSNAYFLAGFPEMSLEDINVRQGRRPESDEIKHYLALRDSDVNAAYASALGEDVESDSPSVEDYAPITCPVCSRDTPPDNDLCVHCGHALTEAGARIAEDAEGEVAGLLADMEGRDARLALKAFQAVKTDGEVKGRLADVLDE